MADNQIFARDVQDALSKREKRGTVFNVGKPHPVFIQKGIPDQPMIISPAVIRKAKKQTGYNDHCVKQTDLERLPELLNNPIALLKSLTSPDKFVVVLDAHDEKERPVVAAINTRGGRNSIDSVYGRGNFMDFIQRTNEAGAVLSVNKKKAIEGVWAYQQYQGETTIDDYQLSLSPQSEDLSRPNHQKNQIFGNQGARPLTRAKEQDMADEFDGATAQAEQVEKTPEEQAFLNALHQRKVIADALKAGTLSCLPGADGYADTEPAVNIANGTRYHGASQLSLKEFQKQNGFPTAEYMTQDAIQKSGIPIRKGEHGVTISFQAKNEESGEWEQKNVRLFNVAQSAKPAELKAYAAQQVEEKAQEKIDFLKKQHGENYQPLERKERAPAPEVTCSSTEPEKYLGAYLAAVSMGSKFKVTPEQKAEFAQKMETSLFERGANGHTNPFKLSKICNAANDHCKEVIKQTRAVPKQEQVQEQNRGRGR